MSSKEKRLLGTLKNVFIGISVEGESGYIKNRDWRSIKPLIWW